MTLVVSARTSTSTQHEHENRDWRTKGKSASSAILSRNGNASNLRANKGELICHTPALCTWGLVRVAV